jgi:uncharacterized protein (TIGR02678 family)
VRPDALAFAAAEERRQAVRALLERQALGAGDPDLPLVRRHREHLAAVLREQLGATLTVTADGARLVKHVALADARPLRLPPRGRGERARPIDERRALGARACVLVCLVAGVLERRGWTQVPLGALADEVVVHARALDIDVDWRARADRSALTDAIEFLTGLAVLTLRAGVSGELESDDEAFYDVERRHLALLLGDPVRCAEAREPADLEPVPGEGGDLAGRGRTRRLVRALVEDPVLLLDDLDAEDRAYFLAQRARLESSAAEITGLEVERRHEGTALLARGRELTDRPFPARGHVKQLALLLVPELCALDRGDTATIATERVAAIARRLVTDHAEHWRWDPADAQSVARAVDQALDVLFDLRLVAREPAGLHVLPVAHRFRGSVARAVQPRLLELA